MNLAMREGRHEVSGKQETSAAIIAEMRDLAEHRDWSNHARQSNRERISDIADRLEAALKREVDKLNSAIQATVGRSDAEIDRLRREIAELKRAGNVAKLSEAMKRVVAAAIVAKNANAPEWILQRMADIFAMATTALAAPPRNCDVGSAKEQYRRFCLCCIKHKMPCRRSCTGCAECYANWAQMPYEKGGAK